MSTGGVVAHERVVIFGFGTAGRLRPFLRLDLLRIRRDGFCDLCHRDLPARQLDRFSRSKLLAQPHRRVVLFAQLEYVRAGWHRLAKSAVAVDLSEGLTIQPD